MTVVPQSAVEVPSPVTWLPFTARPGTMVHPARRYHTWVEGLPVQVSARLRPPSQVNEQSDGMFPDSIKLEVEPFEIVIGVVVPVISMP